jgi:hypothetical protein
MKTSTFALLLLRLQLVPNHYPLSRCIACGS